MIFIKCGMFKVKDIIFILNGFETSYILDFTITKVGFFSRMIIVTIHHSSEDELTKAISKIVSAVTLLNKVKVFTF